ncbi:MAG: hypothetical protein COB24_02080 [Hyphomicrobiales bacterium]|nr:MAG: hypothetical protein COB24_02080 [Hyphomicrobiales bacterium]
MEIDWLEDFLALSTTGVFARAAEVRNISQSAFTRRIKNLEYWIGSPLFDRSVHPVILTPIGESFKSTAIDTISGLNIARDEAKGLTKRSGEIISFIALHSIAISLYPVWMTKIERSIGVVKSRVRSENFSDCVEAIQSGTSDFMLVYYHPLIPTVVGDVRYPSINIAEDRIIAVCKADSLGEPIFSLEGTEKFPYLGYGEDNFLGRMATLILKRTALLEKAEFRYENPVSEALKTACIQGMGIAWLPEMTIKNELDSKLLVKVSDNIHEMNVVIKLHRSIERSRSEVERLWAFASSI